jgi:hypothetical protein
MSPAFKSPAFAGATAPDPALVVAADKISLALDGNAEGNVVKLPASTG